MTPPYPLYCALLLALTGCSQATALPDAKPAPRPVNVITLTAPEADAEHRFSGVVEARQQANLAFKVAGRVATLDAPVGSWVEAGQVLARLESHDYQLTVDELEARLKEARASHKLASSELARVRQAIADDAMAAVNLDRARSAEARASAAIAVLEVNLEKARDGVRYTTLRAPFAGQVGQRFVEAHELVSDGQPILALHTPDALQVVVELPENQLSQLASGQTARLWSDDRTAIAAVATEIASQPHPLKRTYAATFILTDPAPALRPGQTVQLTWQSHTPDSGFCLPAAALLTEQGQPQLVRVDNQQAERLPVQVLRQRDQQLCVGGDLNAGDRIVVAGAHYLKSGDPVGELREVPR
ncbi:efflux RND transporter periplasmic adaptor subunit [Ferrimonas balearica]|uniref:efflux RND transporter periplasmic adaptor subunit n=1 Tax=Ferrimonas balearica TaxID=44012 RepID=UPI001C964D2D|nr:efflux RND transporter periplasmic adaptor subunit [Ferrimonas balearica]